MATPPNERVRPLVREYAQHGGDQRDHRPWPRPLDPSEDAVDVRGAFFQDGSSDDTDVCVWREGNTLYFRDKNMAVGASYSLADLADKSLTTNAQHGNRGGGSLHALATQSAHGFMSATDKSRIDSLWSNHGGKTYLLSTGKAADADKLDGQDGSYYRNAANLNAGTVPLNRLKNTIMFVGGQAIADMTLTGFHDRNELINIDKRGTVTVDFVGPGTPPSEEIIHSWFNGESDFLWWTHGMDATTQKMTVTIHKPDGFDYYSHGAYQPYVHFRQLNFGTQFRKITVEVSSDGAAWYKPADGSWETESFGSGQIHSSLWIGGNSSSGAPLPFRWVRFVFEDIYIPSTYGNTMWLCQLGLRHVNAPMTRKYLRADGDTSYGDLEFSGGATVKIGGNPVWHAGNDGHTTGDAGLDADLLDGQHGSYYLNPANLSAAVPLNKGGTGVAAASKTAAFNALSPTSAGGDFIYRSGSNDVRLPGNTTATKKFLSMTSAVPSWVTLGADDVDETSTRKWVSPDEKAIWDAKFHKDDDATFSGKIIHANRWAEDRGTNFRRIHNVCEAEYNDAAGVTSAFFIDTKIPCYNTTGFKKLFVKMTVEWFSHSLSDSNGIIRQEIAFLVNDSTTYFVDRGLTQIYGTSPGSVYVRRNPQGMVAVQLGSTSSPPTLQSPKIWISDLVLIALDGSVVDATVADDWTITRTNTTTGYGTAYQINASPTFAGTASSASSSTYWTRSASTTNQAPNYSGYSSRAMFQSKTPDIVDLPTEFGEDTAQVSPALTFATTGYTSYTGANNHLHQLFFGGTGNLYVRKSINATTWGDWKQVWSGYNFDPDGKADKAAFDDHVGSRDGHPTATTSDHGFMSATDKTRTDSLWSAHGNKSYLLSTGKAVDADKLDGQEGSYYLNPANLSAAVPINKGGTGATSKTAAFNALSPTTTSGDFIYRSGSNDVRLAGNTTTTKKFLSMTSSVPSWVTLAASDLPDHSHVIGDLPVASSGESSSTKVVRADDSRLSNARTPTAHTHSISHVDGLRGELDSLAGQISAGYGELYVETGDATGVTMWDDQGNQVGTQTFADKFSIGLSDWVFDHINGKADGESHALLRPDLNWQSTPAGTTASWSPAQYLNGAIRTPYILAESGAPDVAGDGPKKSDVEYSLLTFAMRDHDNAPVDQLAFAGGSIWYRRGLKGSPWPSDWKEVADCDWVGRNYQVKSETLDKIHALGHSSTPATGFLRKKGQHDWEIVAEHNHNVLISTVANGASAIGFKLSTPSYTTSGAKLLSLLNGSTEKFSIDKDGVVSASDFKVGSTSVSLEGHTHSYVSTSAFSGHVNGTSNKHQISHIVDLDNELAVRPVGNVVAGDPTSTDDISKGYIPGSLWVNKDTDIAFVCVRADLNNAVWTPISGGGSGGGDPFVSRTKTIATINPSYNSKYSDSFFHFPVTAKGWTTEFLNDNPGEYWIYRHFESIEEEALVRFGTFLVDGLYRSTHMRLEFSYDYGAAWQQGPVLEFWSGSAHEQGTGYMISDWFPLVLEPDMLFRIVGWSEEDDYEIICGTISIELCLIKSNH